MALCTYNPPITQLWSRMELQSEAKWWYCKSAVHVSIKIWNISINVPSLKTWDKGFVLVLLYVSLNHFAANYWLIIHLLRIWKQLISWKHYITTIGKKSKLEEELEMQEIGCQESNHSKLVTFSLTQNGEPDAKILKRMRMWMPLFMALTMIMHITAGIVMWMRMLTT